MTGALKPESELTPTARTKRRWQQARRRERILVNGYRVHPHGAHGQLRSYTLYGCLGPLCYVTWKHYNMTGETVLPIVGAQQFDLDACVNFISSDYPDRRRR